MTLKRWHWIVIALVTVGLVVMAPSDEKDNAKKGARSDKKSSNSPVNNSAGADSKRANDGEHVELDILSRLELQRDEKGNVSDVFNQTSWYVAPPVAKVEVHEEPPPPPPPPPSAPQLPFVYLGHYGDAATNTIFLSKGEKVYTVEVGEVIENTYRVEKYTKGVVTLTYLPLNIVQSMRTGE